MNEIGTQIKKEIPFKELLSRLEKSLQIIDSKTQSFQIDYPRDCVAECFNYGEFGNELNRIVEYAEYLESKIKL